MYLSGIEILGFKSFAQKTSFEFKSGITAIVGPNGCGKSNIVDAIRWVLGEQKTAVLRSDRMENVIFNGSGEAKPLGMAEVALHIKNESGLLPLDYSEVVITRRLFRSGESQYLINGKTSRLKDIFDLTMDTGLGLNAYSVIESAMVESILNGKADERRRIFEEAAGITKYKLRRRATFRKLEATEKDLIRIDDIISEVDKTVRSLHRQVEKARRYQQVSIELKSLECKVANHQFSCWIGELEPLTTKLNLVRDEHEEVLARMAKYEAEYEQARMIMLELDQKINAIQREKSNIASTIHKDEEESLIAQERIRSLEEAKVRFDNERNELKHRLAELNSHRKQLQDVHQTITEELHQAEKSFLDSKRKMEEAEHNAGQRKNEHQNLERQHLVLIEKSSHRRNEADRLSVRIDTTQQRLKEISGEADARQLQFDFSHNAIDNKTLEKRAIEGKLENALSEDEQLSVRLVELQTQYETMKAELFNEEKHLSVLQQRLDFVKRLLESYDDYPEAIRHIVIEENQRVPTHGTLANLIDVDADYHNAVIAALGDAVSFLIVDNPGIAFAGVEILTDLHKGQASFLPITLNSHKPDAMIDISEFNQNDVVGWLRDVITCNTDIQPLVHYLIRDYLIVKDLETARTLYPQLPQKNIHLVTLAGEVVTNWGLIRGGVRSREESANLVGRRAQLEEIEKQIDRTLTKIDDLKQAMQRQVNVIADIERQVRTQRSRIKDLEAQLNNLRVELGKLEAENHSIKQLEEKRKLEEIRLQAEIERSIGLYRKRMAEMTELERQRDEVKEQLKKQKEELTKDETIVGQLANEMQTENVKFVSIQGESKSHLREIDNVNHQIAEIEQRVANWQSEMATAAGEVIRLSERVKVLHGNLEQLYQERKEKDHQEEELDQQQHQINQKMGETQEELRQFRNRAQMLGDLLHQYELGASELRLNIKNLSGRIKSEYEFDLERVAIDKSLDLAVEQENIEKLRRQLRSIGPVNMLALKEYERENDRLTFLKTQREDLLQAKDNLLNTIEKINNTAREKFNETFSRVRENFQQVFANFFDGGKADIVLQTEGDPLEVDIDIMANPGGKRLASLSLMSGGEKTLTAISLLFALYLVKPSPFCILDEVDAPLDDRNIARFSKALRDFSIKTQFIVVTHNKLTMREADQLYGITMERKGVSRVVSVQFDRENDKIAYESAEAIRQSQS